jgi:hypothetical protein
LGFWAKYFHCRFSFGGAIPTQARQEENSSKILNGVHWVFDFILEGVEKYITLCMVFVAIFMKRQIFKPIGDRRVSRICETGYPHGLSMGCPARLP